MAISLSHKGWSRRRLRDGSRLPTLASSLQTVESEIAAGRITLFSPPDRSRRDWSLLFSHPKDAPVWTVNALPRFPGFHRAPLLCAARTFL